MNIGARIAFFRKRSGLTRDQLAKKMGHPNTSLIFGIEKGRIVNPTASTLVDFCMALNVGIEEIVVLEDYMKIVPYPDWACLDCGKKHGNTIPKMATWHEGICDVCGKRDSVTEPRDFGHFKNFPGYMF